MKITLTHTLKLILFVAASNPYLGGPNITPHYNQLTGGLMETERDRAAREARDREQQVPYRYLDLDNKRPL